MTNKVIVETTATATTITITIKTTMTNILEPLNLSVIKTATRIAALRNLKKFKTVNDFNTLSARTITTLQQQQQQQKLTTLIYNKVLGRLSTATATPTVGAAAAAAASTATATVTATATTTTTAVIGAAAATTPAANAFSYMNYVTSAAAMVGFTTSTDNGSASNAANIGAFIAHNYGADSIESGLISISNSSPGGSVISSAGSSSHSSSGGGGNGGSAGHSTATAISIDVAATAAAIGSHDIIMGSSSSSTDSSLGLGLGLGLGLSAGAGVSSTTVEPSVDSYFISMAWPKAIIVAIFLLLILVTIVGNTLVILAVLTTRRLRTVTNCFVMNLAITDWLVGTCVMPPSVILYIVGSWRFGWILCDIWISLDVLLCTGSILSLCAISLDRYLAVTQPLTYSKKRRSKRLALIMIFIVWVTALSITCPPYLGWYEPGRRQQGYVDCRYNQNKGYVVFSAMGSFFIPLSVMLYVYVKIGYVLTSRRQRIVRDANSERTADHDIDCDNFISESEHFQCATPKFPSLRGRWGISMTPTGNGGGASGNGNGNVNNSLNGSQNSSLKCSKCNKNYLDKPGTLKHQPTFYELVELTRLSSLIHCSAISCKYGGACMHSNAVDVTLGESRRASTLPMQALHYNDSQTSFSESCLATATAKVSAASANCTQQTLHGQQLHHHQHHHHQQQHQQHHHHHHRIPMRVSTTKRDTKTAKTLTIVMGGFIACWLPFFVYYLLIPFLPRAAVLEGLMSFLTWVGWVNCAINPFIYAFYNPDFRTAFWRLTCRRICKQKPPPNHMAMFRG